MIRSSKVAFALGAGLAVAFAAPAAAGDVLPCADYITSQFDDAPAMGELVGSEDRSETYSFQVNLSPNGIGGSTTVTRTVSYQVGYYEMTDGNLREIDCRDYSVAN